MTTVITKIDRRKRERYMEPETVKTVGTGVGSGIAGVFATFLAFKSKFRNIVYKDTFEAVVAGIQKQLETQTQLISEQGKDIKEILKNNNR